MITETTHPAGTRRGAAPLLVFFVLSFAMMWALFFTVAMVPISAKSPLGAALVLLGAFAPAFAATAVTYVTEGAFGLRALYRGVTKWHVPWVYYAVALLFMTVIRLTVALILRLTTGGWPEFGGSLYLIPPAIAFSLPFQIGEELGWRGYALPRLAACFGLRGASLLLGLIWGAWHLPQFFIRGGDSYQQSFPLFVLGTAALSVLFAWLYARTGGSLLLTMLLHAAINNSKDIVPSPFQEGPNTFAFRTSPVSWVTLGLFWLCALYFLSDMSKLRLGTGQPAMP